MEVYRLSCSKGTYRIVDDGGYLLHLYTIEFAKDYGDCIAWDRVQGTPIFTNLSEAMAAIQSISDTNH